MNVNTNLATLPPTVNQSPRVDQRTQERAVQQQQPKTTESNIRPDTVTLSAQAQQLSKAYTQQNVTTVPSISSNEQARNTVNQLVTNINGNPNQALSAVGNVNSGMVRSLLG